MTVFLLAWIAWCFVVFDCLLVVDGLLVETCWLFVMIVLISCLVGFVLSFRLMVGLGWLFCLLVICLLICLWDCLLVVYWFYLLWVLIVDCFVYFNGLYCLFVVLPSLCLTSFV